MNSNLTIKPFPLKTATEQEYRMANDLSNVLRAEQLPDDPPVPLAEEIQRMQNIPSIVEVQAWSVTNAPNSAIALGTAEFLKMERNQHITEFQIQVLPQYRRQGIARQLLTTIAQAAREKNRTLLITNTSDKIPSGEAFMMRLGAERGLESHLNQLDLRDLNRDLINTWLKQAPERAAGFELVLIEGAVPAEILTPIVELIEVMNTAPRGSLQVEDFKITPEQYRQMEQSQFARGRQRWLYYAYEKSTGKFVGFTEIAWHPNRPTIVQQQGTGVLADYRGHGLGRWLKAAMLDKMLRDKPEARFVRTGNADSNAAMLKINFELGFKHYISQTIWQVPLEKVDAYLSAKEMVPA